MSRPVARHVALAAALLWSVGALASGQRTPSPSTGAIVGQVVEAVTGAPVQGATVRISGRAADRLPAIQTDAEGRFAFSGLAPGTYSLFAAKPGFSEGSFGARFPGDGQMWFDLGPDERATDVTLRVWRMGVVGGTVRDDAGRPLVNATVVTLTESFVAGTTHLHRQGTAHTNDRGEYRLPVTAGRYAVAVLAARDAPPAVFHPASPSPDRAAILTISAGEERVGVDIRVPLATTVRVSGVVTGGAWQRTTTIALRSGEDAGSARADIAAAEAAIGVDGKFTFPAVARGRYVARVVNYPYVRGEVAARIVRNGLALALGVVRWQVGDPLPPPASEPAWCADVPVIVGEERIDDLAVPLRPCARIAGRVEFDGAAPKPGVDELSRAALVFGPIDGSRLFTPLARIAADGRFQTPGVPPGHHALSTMILRIGPWHLDAVMVAGRRATTIFDVGEEDVDDVVLRFTDRPMAKLSGMATDASARPLAGASVYVVTTDRTRWPDLGALAGGEGYAVRSNRHGVYETQAILPAGEYFVVAVTSDALLEWRKPDVLESLVRSATTVRLGAGETRTLNLRAVAR